MIQACAMPGSGRSLRLIPSPSLTPAQAQAVVGSPFAVVVAPVEIWRGSARLGGGRWAGRRASCRLGRVGATAKESDLARPGEGAFFAPSLLEPSLSLFFPPPFFPPLSPAHIVFSFGLRWGLSLHWMAVFSVPSPLLPSLTPASRSVCLLVFFYPFIPALRDPLLLTSPLTLSRAASGWFVRAAARGNAGRACR